MYTVKINIPENWSEKGKEDSSFQKIAITMICIYRQK